MTGSSPKALIVLAAALAMLVGPASAAAAVTLGSPLTAPIDRTGECPQEFPPVKVEGGCELVTLAASAPGAIEASPIDGTVVRWRVQGASSVPGYGVAVMRRNGPGSYTVTAASSEVTPLGAGVETFTTDLPILAGEYVAFVVPVGGQISELKSPSNLAIFTSPLAVGATGPPFFESSTEVEGAFNAEVEPLPTPTSTPTTNAPPPTVAPICVVPDVVGTSLKPAKRKIRASGCKLGTVTKRAGASAKTGKVVKQRPKPAISSAAGTRVSITLGT